jgi:hypothetical protein
MNEYIEKIVSNPSNYRKDKYGNPIDTPYENAKRKAYCVSFDPLNNNGKGYYGFNTTEFIKFIDVLNDENNYRYFYELLKDVDRKLHFDIDFKRKNEHTHESETDWNNCLTNNTLDLFIEKLTTYLTTILTLPSLKMDDILVFTRTQLHDTKLFHISIHIVIPSIIMNYLDQQKLCVMLKQIDPLQNRFMDASIYSSSRAFTMPFCKKISHKTDVFLPYFYKKHTPFTDKRHITPDMLISCLPKTYILQTIPNQPINEPPTNKSKKTKQYKKSKQPTTIPQPIPTETYNIIKIDEKNICNELIDILDERLPITFFDDTFDWIQMIKVFNNYKIDDATFLRFNTLSIKRTTNPNWTIDGNIRFFNKITDKSHITTFNNIIKKYIPFNVEVSSISKYTDWVINHLKIDIDRTDEIYKCIDTKTSFIFNENIYFVDVSTLNLINTTNNQFVSNYIMDELYIKNAFTNPLSSYSNVIQLPTIKNISPFLDSFIKNTNQLLAIKALYGSGKTHYAIKYVLDQMKDSICRIIFITERNTLNHQFKHQFRMYNFISHLDIGKNIKLDTCNRVICSIESILKLEPQPNDVIILDEYESVMGHLKNTITFKDDTHKYNCLTRLFSLLYEAEKVMILDADLSKARIDVVNMITQNKMTNTIIETHDNNFKDYIFNIIPNSKIFDTHILCELYENKRIVVASSVKTIIDTDHPLYTKIKTTFNNTTREGVFYPFKNVLIVNGNGVNLLRDGVETKLVKSNTLLILEQTIVENNIDCFIYSPTITTGVSINATIFHKLIVWSGCRSVSCRTLIQMLFRTRNLIDKQVIIHNKQPLKTKEIVLETPTELNEYNTRILKTYNDFGTKTTTLFGDIHKLISTINDIELTNSYHAYIEEVIWRLRHHGLNVIITTHLTLPNYNLNNEEPTTPKDIEIGLLTKRIREYIKNTYPLGFGTSMVIPHLNIELNTFTMLLYKLLFWDNGFIIENVNDMFIPSCIQINHTDNIFRYDNNCFYPTTNDGLLNYATHIQSKISANTDLLIKTTNITLDNFSKLLKVYNRLITKYVGYNYEDIMMNFKYDKTQLVEIIDTSQITPTLFELFGIHILKLFEIDLQYGLPHQENYNDYSTILKKFSKTDMFKNITHATKYKLQHPLDIRDITTMLNHTLIYLNIRINVFKKDTNDYKNSIIHINFINFRCKKLKKIKNYDDHNIFINDNIPIQYTSQLNTSIILDEPIHAEITPQSVIRVSNNNPNVKSVRNNIYKIEIENNEIPLKKITIGKKYTPKYKEDDEFVVICETLNKILDDAVCRLFIPEIQIYNDNKNNLDYFKYENRPSTNPFVKDTRHTPTYHPYNNFKQYLTESSCQKWNVSTYDYTPYRKASIKLDTYYYYSNKLFLKHHKYRGSTTKLTDEIISTYKNNVMNELTKYTTELYKPIVYNKFCSPSLDDDCEELPDGY